MRYAVSNVSGVSTVSKALLYSPKIEVPWWSLSDKKRKKKSKPWSCSKILRSHQNCSTVFCRLLLRVPTAGSSCIYLSSLGSTCQQYASSGSWRNNSFCAIIGVVGEENILSFFLFFFFLPLVRRLVFFAKCIFFSTWDKFIETDLLRRILTLSWQWCLVQAAKFFCRWNS